MMMFGLQAILWFKSLCMCVWFDCIHVSPRVKKYFAFQWMGLFALPRTHTQCPSTLDPVNDDWKRVTRTFGSHGFSLAEKTDQVPSVKAWDSHTLRTPRKQTFGRFFSWLTRHHLDVWMTQSTFSSCKVRCRKIEDLKEKNCHKNIWAKFFDRQFFLQNLSTYQISNNSASLFTLWRWGTCEHWIDGILGRKHLISWQLNRRHIAGIRKLRLAFERAKDPLQTVNIMGPSSSMDQWDVSIVMMMIGEWNESEKFAIWIHNEMCGHGVTHISHTLKLRIITTSCPHNGMCVLRVKWLVVGHPQGAWMDIWASIFESCDGTE